GVDDLPAERFRERQAEGALARGRRTHDREEPRWRLHDGPVARGGRRLETLQQVAHHRLGEALGGLLDRLVLAVEVGGARDLERVALAEGVVIVRPDHLVVGQALELDLGRDRDLVGGGAAVLVEGDRRHAEAGDGALDLGVRAGFARGEREALAGHQLLADRARQLLLDLLPLRPVRERFQIDVLDAGRQVRPAADERVAAAVEDERGKHHEGEQDEGREVPGSALHLYLRVTRLIRRPGTTTALASSRPAMCSWAFSLARAAARTSRSSASAATSIRSRSLPSTWTTSVTRSRRIFASS